MKTDHSYGVIPVRVRQGPSGMRREFLLIRHKFGGHWAFPKGHADAGETSLQAAKRELAEETGLTLVALRGSPAFEERYLTVKRGQKLDKTVTYYLGDVLADQPVVVQAEEVSEFAWLSFDAALARMTYPASQALLREAQVFLTEQEAR